MTKAVKEKKTTALTHAEITDAIARWVERNRPNAIPSGDCHVRFTLENCGNLVAVVCEGTYPE